MQTKIIPPEILAQLLSETFTTRFWSHVKIGDVDECWPWLLSVRSTGYGQVPIRRAGHSIQNFQTHRIAWIISNGRDVPFGMCILHSCINSRRCCNPNHLRTGSRKDNMQDCIDQGRRGRQRLSQEQVIQIRKLYDDAAIPQRKIAEMFGIYHGYVYEIGVRKRYKNIPD